MHVANIIINEGGEISLPVSWVSPNMENLNNLTACKFGYIADVVSLCFSNAE